MKRFLLLLTCLTLLCLPALAELAPPPNDSGFAGVWIETDGYGTLTLFDSGDAMMEYYDGTVTITTWGLAEDGYRFGEGMWYNSPMVLRSEDVLDVSDGWMVFIREGSDAEIPAPELDLVPVGEEGAPFCGTWQLDAIEIDGESYSPSLLGMDMEFTLTADGLATIVIDGEETLCTWCVSGPAVLIDVDILLPDEKGCLVLSDESAAMIFVRVPEEPAPAEPTQDAAHTPALDAAEEDFFGAWTLSSIEIEGETYDPALFDMHMSITFAPDGMATLIDGDEVESDFWFYADGQMTVMDSAFFIDAQDCLVFADPTAAMIFTRSEDIEIPTAPAAAAPAYEAAPSSPEDFFSAWALDIIEMDGESYPADLFGMSMCIVFDADGTVSIYADGSMESGTWSYSDGHMTVEGSVLFIDTQGRLILADESAAMIFVPTTDVPEVAVNDTPGDAESPFVGQWYMCYCQTGGLTGDLRTMGVTATLTLFSDGTGMLTGVADEYGAWYEDEGIVRFGESGMPLTLLGDPDAPFLQYGSTMGGYMIFSQDESAQWDPVLLDTPAAPSIPDAAANAPAAAASGSISTGVKYTCTSFTSAGFTMGAASLGAEYALLFHEDGTVDFTVAGFTATGLPCTVNADGQYAIDYYGTPILCVPTDAGVDLDYFGAMTLHFVPAP